MAFSHTALITLSSVALVGLLGCGHSDQNQQAQSPSTAPADTTMTTGAATANPPTQPADTSATAPASGQSNAGTMTGNASGGTTGLTAQTFADAQIAAVTNAANTVEVDQAKEALKKAHSAKVKQYAQHMIADHGAAFKQQTDVERKSNINPAENDTSRQVMSDGKNMLMQLQSASAGNDFDKQYIDGQIKEHQTVLDTLDSKLIPNAQNADLKSYLQKVRDKVADHLKTAKDIQASLK